MEAAGRSLGKAFGWWAYRLRVAGEVAGHFSSEAGQSRKRPPRQDVMDAGARGYEKPERRSNCHSQELASNLWLRVVVDGQARGKESERRQIYQRPAPDSQRRS